MMQRFLLLIVLVLVLAVASAKLDAEEYANYFRDSTVESVFGEVSREEVIANLNRRKEQMKKMLDDNEKKLSDHHAGLVDLTDEEKEKLEKRIEIMARKVERMENMDDQEIDRMHRRETRRTSRRRSRSREL